FGSYCTISSLCPLLSYLLHLSIFFALIRRPPISALFPYTTLFRSGLASGLLGIGGGIIKVPVMNLAMKVPMRVAVATSNFMVGRSEEHTSELQSRENLVCRLLLEKKKSTNWCFHQK